MDVPQSLDAVAADAVRVEQAYARRVSAIRKYQFSSDGYVFGHQERERDTLALLRRHALMPLTERTILDVGCGAGAWIQQFLRWGAQPERLTGIDLRADALAKARDLLPPTVRLERANAAALPFESGSFDIVIQSTMFTSVLDLEVRRQIAAEMLRVLQPNGLIVWYDFLVNNPSNPDVSGVPKREIAGLFTGCRLELRRVTLLPPLMRWLAPRSWFLTYALSHVPPLCTHYLGAISKAVVR